MKRTVTTAGIGQERDSAAPINLGADVQGLSQLTMTMAEAVDSRPVVEGVIQKLDLRESPETLMKDVDVQNPTNTQFIEVTYEDRSPGQAECIVNALGDEFSEQISEVSPTANDITAPVWERAVTPDTVVSPNVIRNGLSALVIGGMSGVSLAFLFEYRADNWRSLDELQQISGVPTVGVIPPFEEAKVNRKGG